MTRNLGMFVRKIHELKKRATSENCLLNKHSLLAHKLYNEQDHSPELVSLNHNQILGSIQTCYLTIKPNLLKVGLNAITNRLHIVNGKIQLY